MEAVDPGRGRRRIGGWIAPGVFCVRAGVKGTEDWAVRGVEEHLPFLRQGKAAFAVFGVVLAERGGIGFMRHKLSFLCGLRAHWAI